jgi:hypothetical protein
MTRVDAGLKQVAPLALQYGGFFGLMFGRNLDEVSGGWSPAREGARVRERVGEREGARSGGWGKARGAAIRRCRTSTAS